MMAVMFEWWLLVAWYVLWIILFVIVITRLLKKHAYIRELRRRGLYPPADREPTIADVQRLAATGEEKLAVGLYEELLDVSTQEARKAVAELCRQDIEPAPPQNGDPPAAKLSQVTGKPTPTGDSSSQKLPS
jgi:hypothetical protein